ncbi:MAG: hypothetical protein RLN75_06185 [Longimicrobiales bacterium]
MHLARVVEQGGHGDSETIEIPGVEHRFHGDEAVWSDTRSHEVREGCTVLNRPKSELQGKGKTLFGR